VLKKHYLALKNVFLHYVANSASYPALSDKDMVMFAHRSRLFDRLLNPVTFDKTLISTIQPPPTNQYKKASSGDRKELHRYEFVEMIVRLAQIKYRDSKACPTLHEAVETLIVNDLLKHNTQLNGLEWRHRNLYNAEVSEVFKKNATILKKLYEAHVNPKEKYMMIADA
jgi:hypothetical protein